jgi:Spy/CpxP family protein refolding chaperone
MEPTKSKAFAVLVAVFLGGFVSGAVALRIYHQQTAQAGSPPGIDLHSQPGVVAEHLRDELALSDAQTTQVEEILDYCIMREADLLTQGRQLKVEARERIYELLDAEQRKKFENVFDGSSH